jgi:hypothetical protein
VRNDILAVFTSGAEMSVLSQRDMSLPYVQKKWNRLHRKLPILQEEIASKWRQHPFELQDIIGFDRYRAVTDCLNSN